MLKFLENAIVCKKHFRYPSTQKTINKIPQTIVNLWLGNTYIYINIIYIYKFVIIEVVNDIRGKRYIFQKMKSVKLNVYM